MANDIFISDLPAQSGDTTPLTDVVAKDDGTTTKKLSISQIAKSTIENFTGSSLAGSSRSVKSAIDSLNSKTAFPFLSLDVDYGSSYSINIDTINNRNGYIYRCTVGTNFNGTSPISAIGGSGNAFILIGFSSINPSNNKPLYGAQLAFGFSGNKIAIRNAAYNASGGEWNAWRSI